MIGKLVKYKKHKAIKGRRDFFGIGIVLDHRHTGRFCPSTELKVYFPHSKDPKRTIMHADIKLVEFLDESREVLEEE